MRAGENQTLVSPLFYILSCLSSLIPISNIFKHPLYKIRTNVLYYPYIKEEAT